MTDTYPPTAEQATQFFQELEEASRPARQAAAGSPDLSPWGGDKVAGDGIVLHYTAGGSFRGSVDWLCRKSWNAQASAHVVIARAREAWVDATVPKWGLVDQLPASVVQIRRPDQEAWHAGWANGSFGIEMASAGEVKKGTKDGEWIGPNGNWTEKIADKETVLSLGKRFWQVYTDAQIKTMCQIARYFLALKPQITRDKIVGHEHVQSIYTAERPNVDKRDAGLPVNYFALRNLIYGQNVSNMPTYMGQETEAVVPFVADALMKQCTQPTRITLAAKALKLLGYDLTNDTDDELAFTFTRTTNRRSLATAQRMLGLVADMVVGPKTAGALSWRLKDRWGVS